VRERSASSVLASCRGWLWLGRGPGTDGTAISAKEGVQLGRPHKARPGPPSETGAWPAIGWRRWRRRRVPGHRLRRMRSLPVVSVGGHPDRIVRGPQRHRGGGGGGGSELCPKSHRRLDAFPWPDRERRPKNRIRWGGTRYRRPGGFGPQSRLGKTAKTAAENGEPARAPRARRRLRMGGGRIAELARRGMLGARQILEAAWRFGAGRAPGWSEF